jgi:hypothetical protein
VIGTKERFNAPIIYQIFDYNPSYAQANNGKPVILQFLINLSVTLCGE